jgi:tetratricopeptide (TPR) repeat protein
VQTERHRFERIGDLLDISQAISVQQRALKITPDGHASLPKQLNNLGNSFESRFNRTGDLADITEAVSAKQRAVKLTSEGDADLPSLLSNLGSAFQSRFEHTGDLLDISEAILTMKRAVQLTPDGRVDLPGWLNNLGNSFHRRFQSTGDLHDISQAVSARQRAVQLTPDGHAELPALLSNLGNSFQCRFERTGDQADIDEAVSALQRAGELLPKNHADLPGLLNSIGVAFENRSERTKDLGDISKAISALEKSVQLTPEGHVELPGRLNNFGNALQNRFRLTGDLSDITEAVSAHERAVQLTPESHSDLPVQLNNLGNAFQLRFRSTSNLSDIADAVSAHQRAVQLIPDRHAYLPLLLTRLGQSQYTLAKFNGRGEDVENAISTLKIGATSISGPPQIRFQAARTWARLLSLDPQHAQPSEILSAFDTALNLVTLIAGLDQTVQRRHSQLDTLSNIALEAASSACSLGRPDKALEWLEQGRCLVWNQLNQLRTPLDDLLLCDAHLAARVRDVATQLDHAGSSRKSSRPALTMTEKLSLEEDASVHLRLAREWEKLLQQVRAIEGFESFLQPSPCSALLQHLPNSGAIIVINVDDKRCDALALVAGRDIPLHIPLPHFSREKAQGYHRDLAKKLKVGSFRMREEDEGEERAMRPVTRPHSDENTVHDILRALWIEVVKPILEALAYSVSLLFFKSLRSSSLFHRESKKDLE